MKENEKKSTGLMQLTEKLRRIVIENPGIPMLVLANEDSCCGDYPLTCCSYIDVELGEFLDCQQTVNEERVYTEREDFTEDLEENMYEEWRNWDGSENEWEIHLEKCIAEYDPYWKPCIKLIVGN